jgi:Protein of unknown function (DUF429)
VSVVAVDWSGRRTAERRYLWTAEAADGELLSLACGRTRAQLATDLVSRAGETPGLVVGFDFSFSLPAWFLDQQGFAGAPELWDAATRDGEDWLRDCEFPFWGRPGKPRPELSHHLRATEAGIARVGGIRPKSTFQIGGAGSVGTGALRGFPVLARLRAAGFAIWPIDAPTRPPVAVEIYPRLLTGAVVKSDLEARRTHLDERHPGIAPAFRELAVGSEDAFDAAVSALVMSRHEDDLRALPAVDDPVLRREGCVWAPGVRSPTPQPSRPADG